LFKCIAAKSRGGEGSVYLACVRVIRHAVPDPKERGGVILWNFSNHVPCVAVSHPRRIFNNAVARTLYLRVQLNNTSTWLLLVFVWIHHVPDSVCHAWSPHSRSANLLSCHLAGCCSLHLQFAMDPSHIMQN